MKENLEIIRAAAIAANPEIVVEEIAHDQGEQEAAIELVTRPIRLADVLLAIEESTKDLRGAKKEKLSIELTTVGMFVGNLYDWESSTPIFWNLRLDDLTQQSPETLQFLADLLK